MIGDLIMILKARSKRLKFFLEKELSLFQCLAVIATVTTDVWVVSSLLWGGVREGSCKDIFCEGSEPL